MSELVSKNRTASKRTVLLTGALVGILFFLIVYGISPLDVTYDAWLMNGHVERDITCDYVNWMHFRNADWTWPLGINQNIGYPYGNAIAVSGPMWPCAVLFKLLSPILPETFQFYGWWVLGCYLLQGLSAALLTSLFTDRLSTIALSSLLFCASPILAERSFRHPSLAIQFVLLLAYYLYVQAGRGNARGQWWKYLLLNVAAVTLFPYFYPLIMGIMCASLLQCALRDKKVLGALGTIAVNIIVPLASGYPIGLYHAKGSVARGGYGYFSMNLNQPLNPASYGDIVWSRFLKVRPVVLGQYDGFNYLGLGVLLGVFVLGLYALVRYRKRFFTAGWALVRRHFFLGLVIVGFFVYAISNTVYWGGLALFSYPLPGFTGIVTNLFRASGRIFYGTYYFIFLVAVAGISKLFSGKKQTLLLGLLVAVQLFDLTPGLMWKHDYFAQRQTYENRFDSALMDYVGAHYKRVIFVPNLNGNYFDLSGELAKQGLATNLNASPLDVVYGDEEFVQVRIAALKAGEIDPDEVIVVTDPALYDELCAATANKMLQVSDATCNMLLPVLADSTPPESAAPNTVYSFF